MDDVIGVRLGDLVMIPGGRLGIVVGYDDGWFVETCTGLVWTRGLVGVCLPLEGEDR